MANEGEDQTRAAAVAKVATRLFGVRVTPDAIIDESLERATDAAEKVSRQNLAAAVDSEFPTHSATMLYALIPWQSGSSFKSDFETGNG